MVGGDTIMTTTPQENAALVRRFLDDVVAGGDTTAVDTLRAGDATDHNLVFGNRHDQEELTRVGWRVLAAADVEGDIDEVVATGETVAVRATIAGVHQESLIDFAPTGRSFTITYALFCRIADGRIAETWSLPDDLGLMQQLGAVPDRAPNRSTTDASDHL